MFQRLASSAFVLGTLVTTLVPAMSFARDRGVNAGGRGFGGHTSQGFTGGGHYSAYSGGRTTIVVPRGYSGRSGYYGRGYVAPRYYGGPAYRGYYGGGLYLGYSAPYYGYGYAYDPGYAYTPGYAYDPGYSSGYAVDPGYSTGTTPAPSYAPAPSQQGCSEGSYDRNGRWIPNPNCYSDQQQQQYDPNQGQYQNQQQYPQSQQYYDPNQQQRYNR